MSELQYTKDHEWIRVEGDVATLGITEYAQNSLGDVVYVDLPEVDQEFAAGDVLSEIESTKSVGELFAPAPGVVVEVNDGVGDDPTLVNSSPFGDGWIVKVRFSEQPETVSEAEYAELTK